MEEYEERQNNEDLVTRSKTGKTEERKCKTCGVVEDMEHVLRWCSRYNDIREKFEMKDNIEIGELLFSGRWDDMLVEVNDRRFE